MPRPQQALLPFEFVRNRGLLSNHWFEHRLQLEPEWRELYSEARQAAGAAEQFWRTERRNVERYGSEQAMEVAFIHPLLRMLGGWFIKLSGRSG